VLGIKGLAFVGAIIFTDGLALYHTHPNSINTSKFIDSLLET
jgi:hypothetical protein